MDVGLCVGDMGTYISGKTIRTGDQQRLVPGPRTTDGPVYTATAWIDDRRVAYVPSTPGGHVIEDRVYIHDIVAPDLLGDRLLAEVKGVRASFDGVAVAGLGWERRRGPRA